MLPFRDLMMSLFFISVGMLLDIQFLLEHPLRITFLTLVVLVIKPLIAILSSLVVGLPLRSSCLLYTSPSPRDQRGSRMPSSA